MIHNTGTTFADFSVVFLGLLFDTIKYEKWFIPVITKELSELL